MLTVGILQLISDRFQEGLWKASEKKSLAILLADYCHVTDSQSMKSIIQWDVLTFSLKRDEFRTQRPKARRSWVIKDLILCCSLCSQENTAPTIFYPVLMTEMMGILSCSHICSTTHGQEALRPRTTFSSLWQEGNHALSFGKSGIIRKSLSLRQRQVKIALGWLIHFGQLCILYYFVNRNYPMPINSNRQFLDKFPFFGRLCSSGVNIEDYLWSWWMQLFSHLLCKFWKQKLQLNNFPWNIFGHFQESEILASSSSHDQLPETSHRITRFPLPSNPWIKVGRASQESFACCPWLKKKGSNLIIEAPTRYFRVSVFAAGRVGLPWEGLQGMFKKQ